MASANPWTPISEDEISEWRKDLPEGAIRETNTAHTAGLDETESDGATATIHTPPVTHIAQAAIPREVAEDIYGMMWKWGSSNRENFALMAQIVRNSNPDAFGHLSDDELATKIEQHAKDAAIKATQDAYEGQWDQGNDLDMWQGKPIIP